jgi:hypothetical protein
MIIAVQGGLALHQYVKQSQPQVFVNASEVITIRSRCQRLGK